MRKYCPPDFSWSFPVKLSLDALFAILRNATCLWLLMITASLYSPILLTHLNILMNHLYCVCVCVWGTIAAGGLPLYEPIIFTYFFPNNYFEINTEEVEQR